MKKIALIATGGTITMRHDEISGALVPADSLEILLQHHTFFSEEITISFFSLFHLDSSDIRKEHWKKIAEKIYELYDQFDGFVITHGTDTMAYSASAVSHFIENLQKPVIFTGSQHPLGFPNSDALVNLEDALYFAMQDFFEVGIAFCGSLYLATECTKWHTTALDAFTAPNSTPVVHRTETPAHKEKSKLLPIKISNTFFHEVIIIKITPTMSPDQFEKMLNISQRIVIEGFGAGGNIPQCFLPILEKRCQDSDFYCILKSQCFGGGVDLSLYAGGAMAQKFSKVISGKSMTVEECVAKLMII